MGGRREKSTLARETGESGSQVHLFVPTASRGSLWAISFKEIELYPAKGESSLLFRRGP